MNIVFQEVSIWKFHWKYFHKSEKELTGIYYLIFFCPCQFKKWAPIKKIVILI